MPHVAQGFEVEFMPTLVNNRTSNPAWDGNMPLSSLESAPVLSVVENEPYTIVQVCININTLITYICKFTTFLK